MNGTAHLDEALSALRTQIAIVERRSASSTAGPRGGAVEKAAQIERLRAKETRLVAKLAARRPKTDTCPACGSDDLFSGFFNADDLAESDGSLPGVRWTTFCNQCGTEAS